MYCRTWKSRLPIIVWATLAAASCARRPAQPQNERIAILRFENLGQDPFTDWMGRAFSEIVTVELSAAPGISVIPASRLHAFERNLGVRPIAAPGISAERALALAAGASRIGYGEFAVRGGRIEARLTIEEPATGAISGEISIAGPANELIAAASALARQISDRAAPYGTRDPRALEAWVGALESRDPASADRYLERAISMDADFGPPYAMLAERKVQRQDREGALALIDRALARRLPPGDRTRLEVQAATLRQNEAARVRALSTLVQLDPRDVIAWRGLADGAMAKRDYQQAVQSFQKALEIEPEDINSWNQLGYAAAYAGDPATAVSALRRYQTLRPGDANPLDSLGDVHILAGRLREAEDFYSQAARKDPAYPASAELFKAAMARLMSDDLAGADAISKQYADAREAGGDALVETYRAEWEWISGRRKSGYDRLAAFARAAENGPQRAAASRCYGELAVWSLMLGDRAASETMSRSAVALAGPASVGMAMVARFLAQPPAPAAEWASRIDQLFPNAPANPVRGFALAYALLLSKEFQPASLVLEKMYAQSGLSDPSLPYLLAWTYLETGRAKDAAPLLQWNPIPPLAGPGALLSFYFPRVYFLRGQAAEKGGKLEDARIQYRMFLQLSGAEPLMWGEEKKAAPDAGGGR